MHCIAEILVNLELFSAKSSINLKCNNLLENFLPPLPPHHYRYYHQ